MTEPNTITTPQGSQATYADLRRAVYPPVAEQLDYLYHNGFDAWKTMIDDIKNQYPKETK